MLSSNKIVAIKMFVNTRLSGKYTEVKETGNPFDNAVIECEDKLKEVKEAVAKVHDILYDKGFSVDNLNQMPDSIYTTYLYNYYMCLSNTYEKLTKLNLPEEERGDATKVIEGVIGFAMLSRIYDENKLRNDLNCDFLDILGKFEKGIPDKLPIVFRMHKIADELITTLEKYDFKPFKGKKSKRK